MEQYGCAVNGTAATKDDEDDDFDLFGSDDEEDVSTYNVILLATFSLFRALNDLHASTGALVNLSLTVTSTRTSKS